MAIMEAYKKDIKMVINGVTMNFCPNCGNKVNREDNFCSACGMRLQAERVYPQEEFDAIEAHDVNHLQELELEKEEDIGINHQVSKRSWVTSIATFLTRIYYVFKYLKSGRKRKLYKQWVETTDLPLDAIPKELAEDAQYEAAWKQFKLFLLYVLLGAAVIIVVSGLIIIILRSC